MLQPHQYLKDIYQMTDEEKKVLADRVNSIGVDDNTLDYDLQTLSALSRAHGFISMAHQLDSDRVWREMQGFVKLMKGILQTPQPPLGGVGYNSHDEGVQKTRHIVQQTHEGVQKNANSVKNSQKGVQSAKKNAQKDSSGKATPSLGFCLQEKCRGRGESLRPNHFDSWFDQMSEKLQAKISTLSDLHTKKKYYRGIVEQLAENTNHSKQDMALAATLTVNYEKKIQAIYDQAQIEWDELQGRSVSEDVKRIALQDEEKADKEIQKTLPPPPSPGGGVDYNLTGESNNQTNTADKANQSPILETFDSSQNVGLGRGTLSDDELKELTVSEIQNSDLPDGPKQYYINKRVDLARGYLKKMTPETMSDEQKQKALGYAHELAHAGKALSPKAKENMKSCGLIDNL